jgi:branched-chain amino acid transport system ATP-binding protein
VTELLTAHALTRTFGSLVAVDRVHLCLPAGARHAVIGPNGAGKTTLLHLLAGSIRPGAGRIVFDGRDITRLSPARRARLGIARTFQAPAIYPTLTALDHLVIAAWRHPGVRRCRRRELARRGLHYLETVGLAAHATTTAGALPHGQRRMLELAMALAARPRLLLLDEPAAGLGDDDLERLAGVLAGELPTDIAMLLVDHNQDLVAAVADTITVLHNGKKVATGSAAEIGDHPDVVKIYLGPAHRSNSPQGADDAAC